MLKQEEIAKRIETRRRLKPWVEARLDGLRSLDRHTRAIGHLLLGCPEGKDVHAGQGRAWKLRSRAAQQLLKLDEPELLRLGATLFPQFPDVFRAAWQLHERLPIRRGFSRKPFRAPQRPELLRGTRIEFLVGLMSSLEGLDENLLWLAGHAAHVAAYAGAEHIGVLLAAAIDMGTGGADEIQQILRDSAEGMHEIGEMGRHVTAAFLCCEKRDCWDYVGKLLLAAQRQEGLRQVILESVDFAHADAFRRMLRVIVENNLVRFSATVRAADVWLGLQLDSQSARYVNDTLESLVTLLDDDKARAKALAGTNAEMAFLALWSIAFDDAPQAVRSAHALLEHRAPEMRFIGVHVLGMLGLPETYKLVVPAVDDADLRVAAFATAVVTEELNRRMHERAADVAAKQDDGGVIPAWMCAGRRSNGEPPADSGDLFERLERLFVRLDEKPKAAKPLVWPWMQLKLTRQAAADAMVAALDTRPRAAVLPYLDAMSWESRQRVAELLGGKGALDSASRQALLRLVGDAAGTVRETAVKTMAKLKIAPADADQLEPLLARKGSDLRRGVLGLIFSMKDAAVLASAERLLVSKTKPQRLAGLDLLQQMRGSERAVEKVLAAAKGYRAARRDLEHDEQVYLDNLLAADRVPLTLDDALGLMDASKRTPPTPPQLRTVKLATPAAKKLLELVDEAVHARREEPVTLNRYGEDREPQPLGSVRFGFVSPFDWNHRTGAWSKRSIEELPLRELWLEVWSNRPAAARDADGCEAARALLMCSMMNEYRAARRTGWRAEILQKLLGKLPTVKYPSVAGSVLEWLTAHETDADLAGFAVDGLEMLLATLPADKLTIPAEWSGLAFREVIEEFHVLTRELRTIADDRKQWTPEHLRRLFGLQRWIDEPLSAAPRPASGLGKVVRSLRSLVRSGTPGAASARLPRQRMDWRALVAAFDAGWANEHDVYDDLLGPRECTQFRPYGSFDALCVASGELRKGELSGPVARLVQRAVDRVLEVELVRGESETPATLAALALNYAGGLDVLVRLLQAIGRDSKLQRTHFWGASGQGKSAVFSQLIRVTMPGKGDTPAQFARAMKSAGIEENALLAVAFYAPQWVRFVEEAVGWELLTEAVWWIHAHTKNSQWRVDQEIREGWNAEIRKFTSLTLEDLVEGAVDVDWFRRVHAALGDERWQRLDKFAKYASGGGGHKRAQLFADAMLNKLDKAELVKAIEGKRQQDAVRALGLLPLGKSPKGDVLERYKLMQEFVRTCRQFGSQRQASEKLAARIGQENLARTAGYPDPIRLQWAMEGLATADLAKGPVTVNVGDVAVQLAIDADGLPEVSVRRGERLLKSIPAEARKAEPVQELTERKTELRRSASRMRQSLELAMCRGDWFNGDELRELMGNVLLRPMLERLVFVGEGIIGYPVDDGKGLRNDAGRIEPVKKAEKLRLAHPADLLATKAWSDWQRECFSAERVQPFKQVFRELYVLTEQEKSDRTFSRRYAGQQVNPRQALALLGSRGWVTAPEAGVFRAFHEERLVGWIEFMEPFYTPAEVEGLTLEKVRFARRGAEETLSLIDVPPRLLSETLRDVDLIVSVAHRGGVDPEASASTVELRLALLRETIQLLKLENVKIKPPHVHICGTLAEYSVHLGSATTHMLPGGALFIVPVHSQHRGRIFLPFADADPKTAEMMSKVLLLARDQEIKDPNLLDQIRSRR